MLSQRNKKWVSLLTVISLWIGMVLPNTVVFAADKSSTAASIPGLVGEWKFEDMTGTVTPDTFMNNDIVVTKAALGSGKFGKALLFNGYDSYATLPNDNLINTGSDFSMSMLVNFNSTYTNRTVVLAQQQGANGTILLKRRPDGRLESALGGAATIGATPIEPKKWYHVALVREGGTIKLYVNGTLDMTTADTHMDSNTGEIRLGADKFPDSSNAWSGYIDELQVYDRALTDDQIRQAPGLSWPAIKLNGNAEMTLSVNDVYTEAGATATDEIDADLTASIKRTGLVDTSKSGIYTIQYTVTSSGGGTVTKVRTVKVIPPKTQSRASRVLIDKGLQMQTWMTTDDSGRKFASADEWTGSHFTTATYYEWPFYNATFHKSVPDAQWSLVKGAFGEGLPGSPTNSEKVNGFLSDEQVKNIDKLVTISFGDEETYSETVLKTFTDWFKLSHEKYPDVLAHSNQQSRQWQRDSYETYIKTAEPDLLTFDDYMFSLGGTDTNLFTTVVNNINDQRTIALRGYDGTGQSPIAFGQYLLGFKTGQEPAGVGPYVITESQVYGVPFATLTMGGKWLSLFRWEYDSNTFQFFDKDGKTTPQYDQYAEMARQVKNLGPHLVRLNSTDVLTVPGQHKESGAVVDNKTPRETPVLDKFNRLTHPYLRNMTVKNLGKQNDGLNGDALIGFFEPLPDTEAFFGSTNMEYFMVMNGLTTGNGLLPEKQHGSGTETQQTITVELNLAQYKSNAIQRVSRETGELEPVALKSLGGNRYQLNVTLNGGVADLFQLDKTKVNTGYVAAKSVSLPSTLAMIPGDTTTVNAVVSPAGASEMGVEWSSSNENIAKVDAKGMITAVAGGNAVITATTVDGNHMAKVAVSVASVTVPVTGIKVTPADTTLYTEDSMKLTASVMPNNATNKAYVWSSGDEHIAKVDQAGTVTAISPGNVQITATTADGSFKGTSSLTVLDAASEASLSELTVNGGSSDLVFNSNINDYTLTINESVDTITLQPRLKNSKGTIEVNGEPVKSGQLITATIPIGDSKVIFVTKAADGIASKTYTVTVKRNNNIALEAKAARATFTEHGDAWNINTNDYDLDSEHSPLRMIDGNVHTYFESASINELNPKGEFDPAHKILLEWDENNLQDFNKLVLVVNKAQHQGLKVLDISTTENGVDWEETNSSNYLTWQTDSEDEYERVTIDLIDYKAHYGEDYKGLRGIYLLLWAANLNEDNRYAISEFELYNEKDATEPVGLSVSDIPVTGVQVNPASVDLLIHDSAKLNAVFAPANASNKTVQWRSSDEHVASVNASGIVTANSVGTAVITATTDEGDYTATSIIQVTNPNSDASLAALVVNDGKTDISFNSSKTDYTINIDPSVDTITVKPTLKKADSTMKINGSTVKAEQWITAKVPMGNSQIKIVVTAKDGATIKTYTITVKRNKNVALEAKAARATFTEHGNEWNINTNDYDLNSEHSPLRMIDGDVHTHFESASINELNPKGEFEPAHKILLEWDENNLQDFNKLVLVVNKAQQQGLKVLDITTTEDGVNWEETNSSNYLTWQTDSEDEYERITIDLIDYKAHYGADYKGLRGIYLLLWSANLNEDNRYAISEFELYNEKDATEPVQITVKSPATQPDTSNPPVTPVTPPMTRVENGSIHLAEPKVDATTGEAKAVVTESDWSKAIETSSVDANGVRLVKVEVPQTDGAKAYTVELPQAAIGLNEAKTRVELTTEFGIIAAWSNMLSGMDLTGVRSMALSIAAGDISSLDPAVKAQIGNRPVIELNVLLDGKVIAWSSPKSPVQVSIPYKPSAEELADPEHIVVWYIDGAGKALPVVNGKYDAATGMVTFKTSHFSKYAVVFVHKTFNDIRSLAWANKQIEVMASKGIINGTSASTFAPTETITRADFAVLLVRALELTADGSDANFSDVAASAYYYKETAIARKLGIATGTGDGKFNPLQPISRQDALVMLHKAMKIAGKSIIDGSASDLDRFVDKGEIATYASDRIAALVHSGIIKGDGVSFHPRATLTRAEAAVMLYNMFSKE